MLDALQLRSGARILDLPCGEGRHAIELPRRGFDVMGIDFNEKAIAETAFRTLETGTLEPFRLGASRLTIVAAKDG